MEKIEESLRIIEENLPKTLEEFKSLRLIKDGIYKHLEFAIQLLIDELSELTEGAVFSYGDIVSELHERGILSDKDKENMEFLLQLREIFIYNYDLVNDEIAFRNMKEYTEMIRSVLKTLRRKRNDRAASD